MANTTKEKHFEEQIEAHLLEHGYQQGYSKDFHQELALIPKEILAFIQATQPKTWEKQKNIHTSKLEALFIKDLAKCMSKSGALTILREGFEFYGDVFKLAYFKPASNLNPTTMELYNANRLLVVRQLYYEKESKNSLDMVLFLNGIPIVTAELKNHMTGQTVVQAMAQYRTNRNPKTPIFRFKERALVHFAVDPDEVMMTTQLAGNSTYFLPFNKGNAHGKGNPLGPEGKHRSHYLWETVWQRDSLLEILHKFMLVQVVTEKNTDSKKTNSKTLLIFPRFHQLQVVRRLLDACVHHKAGKNYLIQHSAGSGKSNSIAWLAHRLATLDGTDNKKIYDCVMVLTDRKVLDQQLQQTIFDMEHKEGMIAKIQDNTGVSKSEQLAKALASGIPIIISTIHTYGHLHDKLVEVPDRTYAIIVDEAHSSQSGEMSANVKKALASSKALQDKIGEIDDEDSQVDALAKMSAAHRGQMNNLSFFAFTATPKHKTLRIFGEECSDGEYRPFDLYSMKQAIEEGFILDVLKNYTTYKVFLNMVKKVEEDPELDKTQGAKALGKFISLHPHNLAQKTEIIIEHFRRCVAHQIGGKAKAMVVTGSRIHAARYKLEFDKYIQSKGYKMACLVAFSGELVDDELPGSRVKAYTEVGMNNDTATRIGAEAFRSELELPERFEEEPYQLLLVANKYQTGFDQPLLHTMYVDKVLSGIQAVQTLSRLNRTCRGKKETFILDFVNEREVILESFQDYYQGTVTAGEADPQRLYTLRNELLTSTEFDVLRSTEIDSFATVFFQKAEITKADHGILNSYIDPAIDRFRINLDEEEKDNFRGKLKGYQSMYAFLSQVVPFVDSKLEKFFVYSKYLFAKLPHKSSSSQVDVDGYQDISYYRLDKIAEGNLNLVEEGEAALYGPKDAGGGAKDAEKELLSVLLAQINERFHTDFSDEDKYLIESNISILGKNAILQESAQVNTLDGFQLMVKQPFEAALMEQHTRNDKMIEKLFENDELFSRILEYVSRTLYDKMRQPKEFV